MPNRSANPVIGEMRPTDEPSQVLVGIVGIQKTLEFVREQLSDMKISLALKTDKQDFEELKRDVHKLEEQFSIGLSNSEKINHLAAELKDHRLKIEKLQEFRWKTVGIISLLSAGGTSGIWALLKFVGRP